MKKKILSLILVGKVRPELITRYNLHSEKNKSIH